MSGRATALADWAAARGYQVAWAPLRTLETLRDELRARVEAGQIDRAFARRNLSFDFAWPLGQPGRWSVVVVAMPRPAHTVSFSRDGRRVEGVLPPTYQHYRRLFEDVRRDLVAHPLAGRRVVTLRVPLKALATRLGLARYGRNNLTYVGQYGSYHQLFAYATDAPLPVAAASAPQEPRLLDQCARCRACLRACPTGAIGEDRVLLRGERCLTNVNEHGGDWPAWVPISAHHCLLGCLRCQITCPANPPLTLETTGIVFSEQETAALVSDGEHRGSAWQGIRKKLGRLGQWYAEPAIGRNVRALFEARPAGLAAKGVL